MLPNYINLFSASKIKHKSFLGGTIWLFITGVLTWILIEYKKKSHWKKVTKILFSSEDNIYYLFIVKECSGLMW